MDVATALLAIGLVSLEPVGPRDLQTAVSPAFLSPAQMFDLADKAAKSGDYSLAERVFRVLLEQEDLQLRNEARFRLAMMYRAVGRHRDAAVLLRRMVDEQPELARVRLELAVTLQQMGDGQSALRELRALRSGRLPSNIAGFVDRITASLQSSKPFGFYVELAAAPDTNINRATRSDTLDTVLGDFDIDQSSQKKSGLGLAARALATARFPVGKGVQLTSRFSAEANLYRKKTFNDLTLEIAAGPEFNIGKSRINVEAIARQNWFGMSRQQRSIGVGVRGLRPLGPVAQMTFAATYRIVDNQRNDLQDGKGINTRISYERAMSPRWLLSGSVGADRFKADDDAYSTKSWSAGLISYLEIGRTSLIAGAEVGRLRADERLSLLSSERQDKSLRLHLGTVLRQLTFKGFAPLTRIVFERNRSTVEFYDYSRVRSEIGVSRAF